MAHLLEMKNICKSFSGVQVLKDNHLELEAGEVHALLGENGAGKSTLIKILGGVYTRDKGQIFVEGKEADITDVESAKQHGIRIIHQELMLIPYMTVAENIFLGQEPRTRAGMIDRDKMNRQAAEFIQAMGLKISPRQVLGELNIAQQQMVEIIRAISFGAKIIVMDEPTSSLTDSEVDALFASIEQLKKKGVGIIYISHRMAELDIIADRITIMRDGEYITTLNTKETNLDEIINAMVGRTIYAEPKTHSNVAPDAPVVLEAKNLVSKDVKDVSFQLHKGEILGLAGLMGAGRTETARLIFGADPRTGGEIYKNGQQVTIRTPQDAVKAGIGYLSEDRKRFGLAIGLSIADNTILAAAEDFCKMGVIDEQKVRQVTEEYIKKINIKTPSISQLIRNLSGGNQQKVIIAKWLVRNCDVLIFDEPTRGIDVGAKSEIYKLMNDLAAEGKSIIMISSELEEVLRMSDRIICMCEGRLTKVLDIQEASQEVIMKYATMRN